MSKRMHEIGTGGLKITGGYVDEEWNKTVRAVSANKLYTEMRDLDPVIGAVLFVVEYLLSAQPWKLEEGTGAKAEKAVELIDSCMHDMEHTWSDFIQEALSMLQYGWAFHEIVYKERDSGGIGWAKLPLRAQDTLWNWETDDRNRILGMWQFDSYAPGTNTCYIPNSKAIHFKTTSFKGNPEGRSILRSAVRPYQFLKRLQEIEAIGIERELAGLPILHVPVDYLDSNASPDKRARVAQYKQLLMKIRRDEREGIIMPHELTRDGKLSQFKFELLSGGGKRSIDTNVIINRYEQRIATTMLAQFILMGQNQSAGSYALADAQASVFTIALQAALKRIESEINQKLVPDICDLNGFDVDDRPKLKSEKLQDVSLATLATFINQMAATNIIQPDDELEDHLRKIADLPPKGTPREPPVEPGMGSNPHGAGAPKNGENKTNPAKKQTDPKDAKGADKKNVRTERGQKKPK